MPHSPARTKLSEALRPIPVDDLEIIPLPLLQQVKGQVWTVEDLLKFWPMLRNSPGNLLYALADRNHQVQGVVWCSYLPMSRTLMVNIVSVSKEYQSPDHDVLYNVVTELVKEVARRLKAERIWFVTNRPRAYERLGYRRAGHVLMEVPLDE